MLAEEDRVRLRHMLDAARSVRRFIASRRREDLDTDEMLAFAVIRGLEIIGEAAGHVSEAARHTCPDIPWPLVVGMRHRLIHAYFDVDLDRVWDTVMLDLPPLITALERVLGPEETPAGGKDSHA